MDSCGWARPTTPTSGAWRSSGRSHLLLRRLLFLLSGPGSTSVAPVGLGRGRRLRNELPAVALVDACLAVSIDLALVVIVDARTCLHAVVGGVVCASKCEVELKLRRGVLPLLDIIVEHTLGLIVGNVDALQSTENG